MGPDRGSPLAAVLFDMDGLLVDTEPLWMRAETATMAALGGQWTRADQHAVLGGPLARAVEHMVRRSGTSIEPATVARMLVAGMAEQLAHDRIQLRPGAAELLRAVAAAGLPTALVSASHRVLVDLVLAALREQGVPPFAVTVAGDEVARTKPDPAPYLRAAELLGVDIARAVVLEDSANGVQAGWAAGAHVVAVPQEVPVAERERVTVRDTLLGLDVGVLEQLLV
jgi:HAD superfamily hydrolase (TIGR01509 family)